MASSGARRLGSGKGRCWKEGWRLAPTRWEIEEEDACLEEVIEFLGRVLEINE